MFLDSVVWINMFIALEELLINADNLEANLYADASRTPSFNLPSVRRLEYSGVNTNGFFDLFSADMFYNNDAVVHALARFLEGRTLCSLKLNLYPSQYTAVLPNIKASRLHMTEDISTTEFFSALPLCVETLALDFDPFEHEMYALDAIATAHTHIKTVEVHAADEFCSDIPFRWMPGRYDEGYEEYMPAFRGHLLPHAARLEKRGIRLCDDQGQSLRDYFVGKNW
jgi:hypothetical protein